MISANLAGVAALAVAGAPATAADMLLLQQSALPDEAAPVGLLVDRERVAVARLRQATKPSHVVEITLVGEPNILLSVSCQDLAGARQVLDALRGRSVTTLDVSGRCRF